MVFIRKLSRLLRFLFPGPRRWFYLYHIRRSPLFDRRFYLAANPTLNPLFRRFPARHYVIFGEAANLRPNPEFSPEAYLRLNPDIAGPDNAGAVAQPFLHYIRHGYGEARIAVDPPAGQVGRRHLAPVLAARAGAGRTSDYAVVAHIYYHDLWAEFAARLAALDMPFDLFVTVTDIGADTDALVARIAVDFPAAHVVRMPNHGRDIFPFVHLINAGLLEGYRAVCKIHSKKSPHRRDGQDWREGLIRAILPVPDCADLVARFLADEAAGFLVADGQCYAGARWWGVNAAATLALLSRAGIAADPARLSFPAGSIYWIKPQMLARIRALKLTQDDFEIERGQLDGTKAHAFERATGYLARADGQAVRQVKDLPPAAGPG